MNEPIMFSIAGSMTSLLARRKRQTRRLADKPPRYRVGEEYWTRETWAPIDSMIDGFDREDPVCVGYKDDRSGLRWEPDPMGIDVRSLNWDMVKWRSPMFMPRFASRASVRIVEVRTEQLHRMTEEDAREEGIVAGPDEYARDKFTVLWNAYYGADAWHRNQVVHVYRFEVTRCVV